MNYELIKNFVDFKKDYDFIMDLNLKYNIVKYYRNLIFFLEPSEEENNVKFIINDIKRIGYNIVDTYNYDSLYVNLSNLLKQINNKVEGYVIKKSFDKIVEENIKNLFNY